MCSAAFAVAEAAIAAISRPYQDRRVQRLWQKGTCPGRRAAFAQTDLIVSRNDDGWDIDTDAVEMTLQVEAADVRHMQVQHQAVRRSHAKRGQELLCRSVGFYLERTDSQ